MELFQTIFESHIIPIQIFKIYQTSEYIQVACSQGSNLLVFKFNQNLKSSLFKTKIKLPCLMPIGGSSFFAFYKNNFSGIIWGPQGDEIKVYSTEGQLYILSLETLSSDNLVLQLLEDNSQSFYSQILNQSFLNSENENDDQDQTEINYENMKITICGVSTSSNCLYDAILYMIYDKKEMTYKMLSSEFCHFIIMPSYDSFDTQLYSDITDKFQTILSNSSLSFPKKPSLKYLLWDLIHHDSTFDSQNSEDFSLLHTINSLLLTKTPKPLTFKIHDEKLLYNYIFQNEFLYAQRLLSFNKVIIINFTFYS